LGSKKAYRRGILCQRINRCPWGGEAGEKKQQERVSRRGGGETNVGREGCREKNRGGDLMGTLQRKFVRGKGGRGGKNFSMGHQGEGGWEGGKGRR